VVQAAYLLTYAFSRSWDNLRAALEALFRVLQSVQDSRIAEDHAMKAGIEDHVWDGGVD
jgi:hypothetical protein